MATENIRFDDEDSNIDGQLLELEQISVTPSSRRPDSAMSSTETHQEPSDPPHNNEDEQVLSQPSGLDLVIAKMLPFVDDGKDTDFIKARLKDLGVENQSDLNFLNVQESFQDLMRPAKLGRFIRSLTEDTTAKESSNNAPLHLKLEELFSHSFKRKLESGSRLSKSDRLKLVKEIGDAVAEQVSPVSEKACLKIANAIGKKYQAAVSSSSKDGNVCLALQILRHAQYIVKINKKATQKRLGIQNNSRFSTRENFGIDPEKDLPSCLPFGETSETQKAKKEQLQELSLSAKINWSNVEQLMKETFTLQRASVNSKLNMEDLLKEWPFFGKPKILRAHFYHLMDISEEKFLERLNETCPKLMKFLRASANQKRYGKSKEISGKLVEILTRYDQVEESAALELAVIALCVGTIMGQNMSNMFLYFNDTTSYDEIEASLRLPKHGKPIIAVLGSDLMTTPKCFIVIEGRCTSTFTVKPAMAVKMVLMWYFVMKITYPKDLSSLLEFFQRYLFEICGTEKERGKNVSRVERKRTEVGWATAPPTITCKYLHFMKDFEDFCALWSL